MGTETGHYGWTNRRTTASWWIRFNRPERLNALVDRQEQHRRQGRRIHARR